MSDRIYLDKEIWQQDGDDKVFHPSELHEAHQLPECVQSDLLMGGTSVQLTDPTWNYTAGMNNSTMDIGPRIEHCFTSKIMIHASYNGEVCFVGEGEFNGGFTNWRNHCDLNNSAKYYKSQNMAACLEQPCSVFCAPIDLDHIVY